MYASFCKYLILRYYAIWMGVSGKISGLKQGIEMTIFVLKRSSSPRITVALPDPYFHRPKYAASSFVFRAKGIICVESSIASSTAFSNHRPCLESESPPGSFQGYFSTQWKGLCQN